jgi:hypothetical protein
MNDETKSILWNEDMKYVKWTLDTLTNVKRLTTEEILTMNLEGRQIAIYPGADNCIGTSAIHGSLSYTNNQFPVVGDTGIIKIIGKNQGKICIGYKDLKSQSCFFTPKHSDMVFIVEKNDAKKGKYLHPEFAWRP